MYCRCTDGGCPALLQRLGSPALHGDGLHFLIRLHQLDRLRRELQRLVAELLQFVPNVEQLAELIRRVELRCRRGELGP